MCIPIDRRDPKTRSQLAIANLSLIAGIVALNLSRYASPSTHAWLDGVAGFCDSLTICIFLIVGRRARRSGT